ncbi:MAG TPA: hypothetical protein DD735_10375 [Clostridiales bacterium]|nr:hypothetical protein [Clostridiales bacterium]
MDNSKIKNFIIIILLIVNLLLTAVIGADMVKNRTLRRQALEGVVAIMESRGITVSEDVALSYPDLNICSVRRDLDAEKKRVSAVLGKVSVQDRGGNILLYLGERGEAQFSGTGVFEILMNVGAVPTGQDPEGTARAFLKKLGMSTVKGDDGVRVDVRDGAGTVVLNCQIGKTEIINCQVTFIFTDGSLMLVSGTRPLDKGSSDSLDNAMDVSTILMRFLDIISESGHVCSRLENLELCYVQSAPASGLGKLEPVWCLTTDAGEFYINGLTGKRETLTRY